MRTNDYYERKIEQLIRENFVLRSSVVHLKRQLGNLDEDNRALQSLVQILNKRVCKKEEEISFYLFS